MLIDVADYLHVPEGPGMVLIGKEADYSMDNSDNRWGLRYNRKTALDGCNQDRLLQALKSTLQGCERLENDDRLKGKIKFCLNEFELFINDRALAPNTETTLQASKADLEACFKKLFASDAFNLEHNPDPRVRFGVTVKTSKTQSLKVLLKNIS